MNLGSASAITAFPMPATEPAKEAPKPADDRTRDTKEDDFNRLIQKEIERKKALADAVPLPQNMMPWLPVQNQPMTGDDEEQQIEAAASVEAGERAIARALSMGAITAARPTGGASARGAKDVGDDDDLIQAVKPAKQDDQPTPVHVVVEAGLPIVQPLDREPKTKVPLADFPQMVAGTATKAVKDGQAITELNFEITPPHVGPVNLNMSIQDRVVSVQLIVPTIQAKQMLEGQLNQISSILQSQNLTPGQVRIVTAASGRSGAGATGQQADQGGFGLMNGGRRRANRNDENGTAGSV